MRDMVPITLGSAQNRVKDAIPLTSALVKPLEHTRERSFTSVQLPYFLLNVRDQRSWIRVATCRSYAVSDLDKAHTDNCDPFETLNLIHRPTIGQMNIVHGHTEPNRQAEHLTDQRKDRIHTLMSHPSRLSPVPWTSLRDGDALRRRPINCIAIADASKSTINTASSSSAPRAVFATRPPRTPRPAARLGFVCLGSLRRAMSCQRQGSIGPSAHQYRPIHTATAGELYAATPSPESQSMASHSQTEFRFWGRGHTASQCLINSVPTVTSAPNSVPATKLPCFAKKPRQDSSNSSCLSVCSRSRPSTVIPHTPTLITCPSSRR